MFIKEKNTEIIISKLHTHLPSCAHLGTKEARETSALLLVLRGNVAQPRRIQLRSLSRGDRGGIAHPDCADRKSRMLGMVSSVPYYNGP
jgi:hypothetical protein